MYGLGGLLEKVVAVLESEEGDGVGHHPNVSTPAVVVGLGPGPIPIPNSQDHVSLTGRVRRGVEGVRVVG